MTQYEIENDILFNNFLNDYFYKEFKKGNDRIELELIISPVCNLGCKYCYLHKYYHKSFHKDMFDHDKTIANLKKILKWIEHNNFKIELDIFSGELFAQKIGYEVMDIIYEWCKENEGKIQKIVIPTNFTFICSEEYTKKVGNIVKNFEQIGIQIRLSASFDGKYCEENRPYVRDLDIIFDHTRDDNYYNKVFDFIKEYDCGLHPMIYSHKIESWKDNFLWFQEQLEKNGMDWRNIYLLQVRNMEWTDEQIHEFYNFIYFLCDYSYNKLNKNSSEFIDFIYNQKNFNILGQPFGKNIGKGLPCALQTELTIRVSDLKVFPCHRLLYKDFEIGQYEEDEQEVLKFKTKNASLGLTVHGFHTKSHPTCRRCSFNKICIGGCLGAQYETNGSMFVPIQSVCKLNIALVSAILKFCMDNNFAEKMIVCAPVQKQVQLTELKELLK